MEDQTSLTTYRVAISGMDLHNDGKMGSRVVDCAGFIFIGIDEDGGAQMGICGLMDPRSSGEVLAELPWCSKWRMVWWMLVETVKTMMGRGAYEKR